MRLKMPTLWIASLLLSTLGVLAFLTLRIVSAYAEYLWYQSFSATVSFWPQYATYWVLWAMGAGVAHAWLQFFALAPIRRLLLPQALPVTVDDDVSNRLRILDNAGSFVTGLVSAAIGVFPASEWNTYLLWRNGATTGKTDAVFGRDTGFYLFTLPWLTDLVIWAGLILAAAILVICLSWFFARLVIVPDGYSVARPANNAIVGDLHSRALGWQASYAILVIALGIAFVAMPGLAYTPHSTFTGAGTLETGFVPSLYWLFVLLCIGAAGLSATWAVGPARPKRLRFAVRILSVWAIAALLLVWLIPNAAYVFTVKPRESTIQTTYIANNIAATRQAFSLNAIEAHTFTPNEDPRHVREVLARNAEVTKSIRLWDWRVLKSVFRQVQTFRQYYQFSDVDVDQYRIADVDRLVMVAARELNPEQAPIQTWVSERLQYTHGYGLVAIPVNEVVDEGMPRFLVQDMPPKSPHPELTVTRPQIYFGEHTGRWAVVNTKVAEIDYPGQEKIETTRYTGRAGIAISSFSRRILFAWHLGSLSLLLSDEITPESRLLFDRDIATALQKIAPFLRYDRDPYPVAANGKIYWMVDALTASSYYPHATPIPDGNYAGVNYARNSVKVTVDAYDGVIRFYVFDPADPLIQAYQRIYPGLFRPATEMPAPLRAHVRFSEDLFKIIGEVYRTYHMSDPAVFYNRQDVWEVAQEVFERNKRQAVEPYYVRMQFPGSRGLERALIQPFSPTSKQVMAGWLAARVDGEQYGKLVAYEFPKGATVYGPLQVEARIDQNEVISREITLWDQKGSEVIRGNMLAVPIEDILVYVEPLYLKAEALPMPTIKRVTVSIGSHLVMAPTLADALKPFLERALPAPPPVISTMIAGPATAGTPNAAAVARIKRIQDELETLRRELGQESVKNR